MQSARLTRPTNHGHHLLLETESEPQQRERQAGDSPDFWERQHSVISLTAVCSGSGRLGGVCATLIPSSFPPPCLDPSNTWNLPPFQGCLSVLAFVSTYSFHLDIFLTYPEVLFPRCAPQGLSMHHTQTHIHTVDPESRTLRKCFASLLQDSSGPFILHSDSNKGHGTQHFPNGSNAELHFPNIWRN